MAKTAEAEGTARSEGSDAATTSSVSSTEAQNSLGEILGRVTRGERVLVTRYGHPEAVILSAEAYWDLVGGERVDLTELEREFDELLARMQTPDHAAATDALFEMSGEEVGRAAAGRAEAEEPEDARP